MQVRTENLYYLLCYAWDHLEARDLVPIEAITACTAEALLGRVLLAATQQLVRQKLDQGYIELSEDVRRPRGKIDLLRTMSRSLDRNGLVACTFDEYSEDVLHNRIVKATCRRLAQVQDLPKVLSTGLLRVTQAMPGVRDVSVSTADFRRIQVHANVRRYRLALHLCALVHRCLVPHPSTGALLFRTFTGDEREMGLLFESFVRSFLQHEQRVFPQVNRSSIRWQVEGDSHGLLPRMQTDITMRRPGQTVVIETKCYGSPLVGSAHGGRDVLRSKDLYQLLAYLSNLSAHEPGDVSGVLLYAVDRPRIPPTRVRLLGFDVLIAEIDLNRPWDEISAQILALVANFGSSGCGRYGSVSSPEGS